VGWDEKKHGKIEKVWCTANGTYLRTDKNLVLACGLNNGGQLGFPESESIRSFRVHEKLSSEKITKIVGGSFHALALTDEGNVLAWGRADYCGVGKSDSGSVKDPIVLEGVCEVVEIAAGSSHCLACDVNGDVFTWGFGETYQLANFPRSIENPNQAEPECKDELRPYCVDSKQLKDKFVFGIGAGAQHSVELGWDGDYAERHISMSVRKRHRESDEAEQVTKRVRN
jgi:alpha-tubulin suppressor-like RCC1 family protein